MNDLLDALGYVGSSLDKLGPRPLRGLLAGHPRELASIVPFSDELGLTDPNEVQQGRDVTNAWGLTRKGDTGIGSAAAGALADLILDPVGLAAGGYGAYKGARAAHAGLVTTAKASLPGRGRLGMNDFTVKGFGPGHAVQNAIDYHGPGYPAEEGQRIFEEAFRQQGYKMPEFARKFESLDPAEKQRIFQEIAPGSKQIGKGSAEALVFATPHRSVTTIRPALHLFGADSPEDYAGGGLVWPAAGRQDIPQMLRPIRTNDFGGTAQGMRVEHLHKVNPLDNRGALLSTARQLRTVTPNIDPGDWRPVERAGEQLRILDEELARHLGSQVERDYPDLVAADMHPGNLSTVKNRLVIHDPGAILPNNADAFRRSLLEPAFRSSTAPDEQILKALLGGQLGDGDPARALREALEAAARDPRMIGKQGVPGPARLGSIDDPLGYRESELDRIREFIDKYSGSFGKIAPANWAPVGQRKATPATKVIH